MTIRAFVALEIPDDALNSIIKIRNDFFGTKERIKWESKDKLHLTLKFLGDTDSSLLERLESELNRITDLHIELPLKFSRIGTFNKDNKPRILWVGFEDNKNLQELYSDIENSFKVFGFKKEERKFHPHLTLLRVKGYEDMVKLLSFTKLELPDISFAAGKISLIKSELKPTGSVYTVLKNFYLKK